MALSATRLPCKCEDLSLIPRTHVKMLGQVAASFSPSAGIGDLKTRRPLGLLASKPSLFGELQSNEKPCLKGGR